MRIFLLLATFCASFTLAIAQDQNKRITGTWWNEEKTGRIEVFVQQGKICGKVVWLKEDENDDGTKPKQDRHNNIFSRSPKQI